MNPVSNKCLFASIDDIWANKYLTKVCIPDIQRGLVWNAAQIEVFWDSLLRGIPIGIFTVVENAGEKMLLDGQQRWHAIQCVLNADPSSDGILWVGILDQDALNAVSCYNRKYLFRWTTKTHPWGFRIDKNEKSSPRLNIDERRNVLLWNNSDYGNTLFQKPAPGRIKPFLCDKIRMVTFSSLYLQDTPPQDFTDSQKQYWHDLKATLMRIVRLPIIPIMGIDAPPSNNENYSFETQQASEHDSDWVDTFFLRMNSQGTPFSSEELSYSSLKSELSKIGIERPRLLFESMAKDFGNTSYIAIISLQVCMCEEYGESIGKGWSAGEIKSFFTSKVVDKDKIQARFEDIKERFSRLKLYCDDFNANTAHAAILPFHIAKLPAELLRYALVLLNTAHNDYVEQHKALFLGSIFLIQWFCLRKRTNDDIPSNTLSAITEGHLIKRFRNKSKKFSIPSIIAECIRDRLMVLPVSPCELESNLKEIQNNLCSNRFLSSESANQLLDLRLGKTFRWDLAKQFVTMACGKYLNDIFKCDTSNIQDDFIPWDYDHLFPQNRNSDKTNIMCWSAGNCVPIALTTNRSRQDQLPGINYPDNNLQSQEMLYLDLKGVNEWDKKPDAFNKNAFARFIRMYEEIYTSMKWSEVYDSLSLDNNNAEIANEMMSRLPGFEWYYVLDGREFPVSSPKDFQRYMIFVLRSSQDACMAINTHDFNTFDCGKRKAALQPIARQAYWWISDFEGNKTKEKALEWLKSKTTGLDNKEYNCISGSPTREAVTNTADPYSTS